MLNVLVPHVRLDRSGVLALRGEIVTRCVPEKVEYELVFNKVIGELGYGTLGQYRTVDHIVGFDCIRRDRMKK